jgi:MFS family permease
MGATFAHGAAAAAKMETMPSGGEGEGSGTTTFERASRAARFRHLVLGPRRVVPLSSAQALAAAGDAFVSVSLAGSLFFNVSPNASRQQILLYLLITMAPLAVLSPLVGPAVDRFRRSQRYVASSFFVARAVFCLLLAVTLLQVAFYPIVLCLLIASKASGIAKQTLVQTLVDDPEELVATNARIARFSSVTAAIGVAAATGVFTAAGAEWSLRSGAVLFALAGATVLLARPRIAAPTTPDDVEYAETHLPTVVVSSIGMLAIRAAVGFFIFTLAFTLRRSSEPALVYGLAAACYGAGAFLGHTAATVTRRWFSEEQLIGIALALPAAFTAVGVLGASIPLLLVISALVGLSTTLGRNAFDGLLQRRAPEALLGRAGARYETRFQLAWVFGGILATPISLPVEVSMMVLSAMYVPALVIFVRGVREAHRFEGPPEEHLGGAHARFAMAQQAWEAGSLRVAIVDASAAVDLAQSVVGDAVDTPERCQLDELRRRAIDTAHVVRETDAVRALKLAEGLLKAASPT